MTKLTIIAQVRAVPGKAEMLLNLLAGLIPPTLAEPGCEAYELHRSLEEPELFHFHEVWTTTHLWEAHMKAPHLVSFGAQSTGLIAESKIFQMARVA